MSNFEITKHTAYKQHETSIWIRNLICSNYVMDKETIAEQLLIKFFDTVSKIDLLKQRSIKYVKH